MKIRIIFIALLLVYGHVVQAQRYNEEHLLSMLNIAEQLTYEVHFDNGIPRDTIFTEKRVFNQKGKILSVIPIKINGLSMIENYQYSQDTILESMECFRARDGAFLNRFEYRYDKKKRTKEEINFDSKGPNGSSNRYLYNERYQLIEQSCVSFDKITSKTNYIYSPEGEVIKYIFHTSDGKVETLENEFEYDDKSNPIAQYRIRDGLKELVKEMKYNEKSQLLRTSYVYRNRLTQYLSIQKPGLIQEGDRVENIHTYYDNGLLESSSEYVNGEIRLTIFYRYFQ